MPYISINLFETPNNMNKCLEYLKRVSTINEVKFRLEKQEELFAVVGLIGEELNVKKVEKKMRDLSLKLNIKFC